MPADGTHNCVKMHQRVATCMIGNTTNMRIASLATFFFGILLTMRFVSESILVSSSTPALHGAQAKAVNEHLKERYDENKVKKGKNYPVCQRLDKLFDELLQQEQDPSAFESSLMNSFDQNEIHCGRYRTYGALWIFGKKHYERTPAADCVPKVLEAKRNMLIWIAEQCGVQNKHNKLYAAKSEFSNTAMELAIGEKTIVTEPSNRQRGVLYTGLPEEHFMDIYQSVLAHRNLGVALPVEVWVDAEHLSVCREVFESPGAFEFLFPHQSPMSSQETQETFGKTSCYALPSGVKGFASKFYALLGTQLTDVIFMDADNIAVRDVNEVFDSEEYKATGSVLWPDLWGEKCRNSATRGDNGYTAFPTHIIWQCGLGGLRWQNTRDYAHEAEAGQIAFDLTRHGGLLELGRQFIENGGLLKDSVNGDKDIFRLIHLMMGEPFSFVKTFPGYSTSKPGDGRDCLTHYFGRGGEAGEANIIASDKSGAFELVPAADKRQIEETIVENTRQIKTKTEPSLLFKFGSAVGSIFGTSNSRMKTPEDCAGISGACGGKMKAGMGAVVHEGSLVPLESITDAAVRQQYAPVLNSSSRDIKAINKLGNPAGTGYNAPIGTDPMFFHQLKMREPRAFRFAYRTTAASDATSDCFEFTSGSDPRQTVEKLPSADRLYVFASKLFMQVDWKWTADPSNSWSYHIWLSTWRSCIISRYPLAVELLTIPALLFGVVALILLRKSVTSPSSSSV
eukprot:GSChrysophyteH1.ASY1.ANO1.1970.1 assembled CDS